MLGYVFWHAAREGVNPCAYAEALAAFHAALASDPPAGFIRSFSTHMSRLPWLDAETAYEDWYLVENSAALDTLETAAVDARRRSAHDVAANAVHSGAGGLYSLLLGEPHVPLETLWLTKPDGVRYADFRPTLEEIARDGATLWQRKMVLGPAPEFAAQSRGSLAERSGVRIVHQNLHGDASGE